MQKKHELELILNGIEVKKDQKVNLANRVKLLDEVPCGSEYSHCKFIKNAYLAQEEINLIDIAIEKLTEQNQEIGSEVLTLNSENLDDHIAKYNKLISKESITKTELSQLSLSVEKNNNLILSLQTEVEKLEQKSAEYEQNKEAIENLEALTLEKDNFTNTIEKQNKEVMEKDYEASFPGLDKS